MDISVRKISHSAEIEVPASKSILNRALLLSAFSKGQVRLIAGGLSEDTRTMLACLSALGIGLERTADGLIVEGCGGNVPVKNAELNVESAGTAARFLPAMLAFSGGDYTFTSSAQMRARPMGILPILSGLGVKIRFFGDENAFPFRLISEGPSARKVRVGTERSTQDASALFMAGGIRPPFTVEPFGPRAEGSYLNMTLRLLSDFGFSHVRRGGEYTFCGQDKPPALYRVEGDLSGACYFFAAALLCRTRILVRNVRLGSIQGDEAFLRLLKERGLRLEQSEDGLLADGTDVASFTGFDGDFSDFSDQTLTAAALAPFASTPSRLKNIEHIRFQESDRIRSIVRNLDALGVPVRVEGSDLLIEPCVPRSAQRNVVIESFKDHRVAMAFALIGLKTGNILIKDAECCKKTFENYFGLLERLT